MIKAVILSLVCLSAPVMASTLAFATGGGRGHEFTVDGNARVTTGSLVVLGYLTSGNDLSSFVEFGRTTMGTPTGTLGGFLTAPVNQNDPDINKAAAGKQVVIWVYNATTAAASTAEGVFTSSDASWTIPATFTGGATESSNITLGSNPAFANVTALKGSYSTGPIEINGTANAAGSIYNLVSVPEVSTSLLASLSILGLVARRKR